ncbi:hypothetical protein Tco_0327443 [Tanacetum coccineum]
MAVDRRFDQLTAPLTTLMVVQAAVLDRRLDRRRVADWPISAIMTVATGVFSWSATEGRENEFKEKEAAELEAKRKIQECLNIEEKSIPQASTRSRKFRIDPTLSNFTISTKRILLSDFEISPVTPNVETVNSLSMGDKHLDTSKIHLNECSESVPIPISCQQTFMLPFMMKIKRNKGICYKLSPSAITPDLPIMDSLIMEDDHLDTIPVTESANIIKSSVDDLVPTPSESADLSDGESDVINSKRDEFKYFSNPLYDLDDEIITNEKILPNQKDLDVVIPIPPGIDERCFNVESNLLESLLNRDSPIDSTKIDSIFDEFSLPRPPEESNSEISNATIESLSPSPILIEDSDSLMEEVDLFLASDDSMPSGIEIDYYDSEGDIRFLEELLSNDSPPLPENESFSLDHFDDPSLPHPPPEPPDVEICFNFEPDAGVVTKKVVGDISEHDVLMPNLLPTQPTLCPVFDLLLPFSSENEDKVFKPGIFSSPFSSHRAKITFDFSERPMMISGGDIPHLDVPYLHFYPP